MRGKLNTKGVKIRVRSYSKIDLQVTFIGLKLQILTIIPEIYLLKLAMLFYFRSLMSNSFIEPPALNVTPV